MSTKHHSILGIYRVKYIFYKNEIVNKPHIHENKLETAIPYIVRRKHFLVVNKFQLTPVLLTVLRKEISDWLFCNLS